MVVPRGIFAVQVLIVQLGLSATLGLALPAQSAWATPGDPASACMDLIQTGENALSHGQIKLADKCFLEALNQAQKLGNNDRHVALALNDLALTTASNPDKNKTKKEKLDQAIVYQKRSIAIEEKFYGPDTENVGFDLNNLGVWYGLNGQLKEGEATLTRAVKIREKALGQNDDRLAVTMGSLADNLKKQKRYIEAVALLKRAEQIYKATNHAIERGRVLNELADVYEEQDNYAAARGILSEVLAIRQKVFGKDSLVAAETLHNLAACNMKLGKNAAALPLLKEALGIVKKGNDPEISATVEASYQRCQAALKKPAAGK